MNDIECIHYERMQVAIDAALIGASLGEVPVGAAIYIDNELVSSAYNLRHTSKSVTAHAEILAINKASEIIGDWRLDKAILYSTAEPCFMCAGAIIHARIGEVYFGVREPKFGGVVSCAQLFDKDNINHKVQYTGGLYEDKISMMMKEFFRKLRDKN